jgi:hypothetical protein
MVSSNGMYGTLPEIHRKNVPIQAGLTLQSGAKLLNFLLDFQRGNP